eukprot:gene11924-5328_t
MILNLNQDLLKQISEVLDDIVNHTSHKSRQLATNKLNLLYTNNQDFTSYLGFIFNSNEYREESRLLSLNLLNSKLNSMNIVTNVDYIKSVALSSLEDPVVEEGAIKLVINLVKFQGITHWPDLISFLVSKKSSMSTLVLLEQIVSFSYIFLQATEKEDILRYCEENIDSENTKIRELVINMLISISNDIDQERIKTILKKILNFCNDKDDFVQLAICHFISTVLDNPNFIDVCLNHVDVIWDFLLTCTNHPNLELVQAASETWCLFVFEEDEIIIEKFKTTLKKLVPILVSLLVKTKDINDLDTSMFDDDDNYDIFEKDIRRSAIEALEDFTHYYGEDMVNIMLPIISKNLKSNESLIVECGILSLGILSQTQNLEKLRNFIKENLNFLLNQMKNDASIIKTTTMWTLGKYSSYITSSTNEICSKYILNVLNLMNFDDVQVQQAALNSYLSLIETSESRLLDLSFDQNHDQNQTLDQTQTHTQTHTQEEQEEIHFNQTQTQIQTQTQTQTQTQIQIQNNINPNQPFMRIVEKIPITSPISQNFQLLIETFTQCLNSYQDVTNILLLYECITFTFEFMKSEIIRKNQKEIEKLLEELIKRLKNSFQFDDEISAILSCLTSIAVSHEKIFEKYSEELIKICIKNLKDFFNPNSSSGLHNEFKDIIIACLDFISETIHMIANKKSTSNFIGSKLIQFSIESIRDDDSDVRQSGFGLLGELIKLNVGLLKEKSLVKIYPIFNESINDERPVVNNSIWALGELSIRKNTSTLNDFLSSFIHKLVEKLNLSVHDHHLGATIALTLGRLEINFPNLIEPILHKFFKNWCLSILNSKQNSSTKNENDSVFSALVSFIKVNQKLTLQNLDLICSMINKWEERNLIIEQDLFTNLYYLKLKFSNNSDLDSIFEKNQIKLFQISRFENLKSALHSKYFVDVIIK